MLGCCVFKQTTKSFDRWFTISPRIWFQVLSTVSLRLPKNDRSPTACMRIQMQLQCNHFLPRKVRSLLSDWFKKKNKFALDFCVSPASFVRGLLTSLCLCIPLSHTHTGTRMLPHTWTHICSTHGRRRAYTCQRICDYNQINWSISPWKHHIYTLRPLVAFSWMLLTLTRSQAACTRLERSQHTLWHQHRFMAYMLEKLLWHLQPCSVWQRRNFYLILLRVPDFLYSLLVKFDSEKPFF